MITKIIVWWHFKLLSSCSRSDKEKSADTSWLLLRGNHCKYFPSANDLFIWKEKIFVQSLLRPVNFKNVNICGRRAAMKNIGFKWIKYVGPKLRDVSIHARVPLRKGKHPWVKVVQRHHQANSTPAWQILILIYCWTFNFSSLQFWSERNCDIPWAVLSTLLHSRRSINSLWTAPDAQPSLRMNTAKRVFLKWSLPPATTPPSATDLAFHNVTSKR